jgi:SAM-dependent methyltransferase
MQLAKSAALTRDQAVAHTAYDEVPYPGHSHAETHPNRIAAIARLFGVAAPSLATSRILEIACGDGSNLLPIAYSLPQAHCTGFDLATSAIERAHARAASLQLRNVDLFAGDLASIGPIGHFDYIVAHGLYSWAPSSLRDALLRLIHRSLSPNGVAFVSYNTFPGWHVAGMVREMLRYHTRGAGDAGSKVMQARALLDFLRVAHNDNDPYGRLLAAEAERFARHSSAHMFHDDLADVNDPVYFEEFVAHAARFELVQLADADFATMTANDLPAEARAKLEQLRGDPVTFGQYLDFVRCRRFRESLLCRAELVPASVPVPGAVRALLATSAATATATPVNLVEGVEAQFRWGDRASLVSGSSLAKAAMVALREQWPGAVTFGALLARAAALLGRDPSSDDAEALHDVLLEAFGMRMVELTAENWRCTTAVSERPRASRMVRHDAAVNDVLVALNHRRVRVEDDDARQLLVLCDGEHAVDALLAALAARRLVLDREVLLERLHVLAQLALFEA